MNLSKKEREEIRMMFGGKCAYCGISLDGKWHVDHVLAVDRDWDYVAHPTLPGFAIAKPNGKMRKPENDCRENLFPACVKCNILKGKADIEGFRQMLAYFATSIPTIYNYSHVHHLMRFGKLTIDTTPVVFYFEKKAQENS